MNPFAAAPNTIQALLGMSARLRADGLEPSLGDLVKIRASEINGCANCLHMHASDARKAGETEARIYLLDAWRESTIWMTGYSGRRSKGAPYSSRTGKALRDGRYADE